MNIPSHLNLSDFCSESVPAPEELSGWQPWHDNGYLICRGLIPDSLVDRYREFREPFGPVAFAAGTPYMQHSVIRDITLYKPLVDIMRQLVGENVGLHLNLTNWVSTERDWHVDAYLNPSYIGAHYIASWIALDTINVDCGPFEFVPGSHRLPVFQMHKLFEYLTLEERGDPDWPTKTQSFVASLYEKEIASKGLKKEVFTATRGDVLLWDSRLVHRGSKPRVPGTPRKSIISHYSALSKRIDMPNRAEHTPGCYYFVL